MSADSELIVVTVDDTQIVAREAAERSVVFGGEQGPQGPVGPPGPAGAASVELIFAFGDATPSPITTALAGKLVYSVQVHIRVPFDGAGAALTVGDAGQADRLMKASENDVLTVGANTTAPAHAYAVDTPLSLSITPGAGATQGAGVLVLGIQQ